jgi:outer membrane protein assembly factor BamB
MDARIFRTTGALLGHLLLCSALTAAPVGWRTDGTGAYPDAVPPTDWGDDHVVWKTKLPGNAFGSPILVGDRVFVVSDPAEVLCLNRADGKVLWQKSHALEDLHDAETARKLTADFTRLRKERDRLRGEHARARDDADRKAEIKKQLDAVEKEFQDLGNKYPVPPAVLNRGSGNSAATPVSDGKNVYALFGNGIVCAYSAAGEKRWVKFLEASPITFGHSSSPVLVDGKLLIHLKDLVALNPNNGEEIWRVALPPTYATAVPMRIGTTTVIVSPSGAVVRVSDGKVLLRNGSLHTSECTALVHDETLYVCGDRARALRLTAAGDDAVKVERLWETRISGGRRTPSAVLHDGLLYAVTTDGKLDVLDARSGEAVYQQRLNVGEVYASATAAGKYLFFGGTKGAAVAVKAGKEYDEAASNKVDGFGSSPVFSGRRLYLRTRQYLYCIGK